METRRSIPMTVKYWSRAGLMLTDRCNAACASCYLHCGPEQGDFADPEELVTWWADLQRISPHGCRVHITGGEPFLDWERLSQTVRLGQAEGLGPLEYVETNGFWATDQTVVRDQLRILDEAGMEALAISADPYHQQYVPLQRVQDLARWAEEILGPNRLKVRWEDWLRGGEDTAEMPDDVRRRYFADWVAGGRDRINGRAAALLSADLPRKPAEAFIGQNCRGGLLRGKHIHIGPTGYVMPGVCAGLMLGDLRKISVESLWPDLAADAESEVPQRKLLMRLVDSGPTGLLELAEEMGYSPEFGYAGKCHLCWATRMFLSQTGEFPDELGPSRLYGNIKA